MEDSGYYSHRSSQFRLSGSASGSLGRIPTPDDIFNLTYSDLSKPKYRYFRYGFTDEEDFEEFKEELRNFRRLKRETKEEFVNDSPDPLPRDSDRRERESDRRGSRETHRRESGDRRTETGESDWRGENRESDRRRESRERDRRESGGGRSSVSSEYRRERSSSSSSEFGSTETVKVSRTYRTSEEVREERGAGDGGTAGGAAGRPDSGNTAEWGNLNTQHYTARGEEQPFDEHAQVRRIAGVRGETERNKRNGVYFDEDVFLDESCGGVRCLSGGGGARSKRASDGDGARVKEPVDTRVRRASDQDHLRLASQSGSYGSGTYYDSGTGTDRPATHACTRVSGLPGSTTTRVTGSTGDTHRVVNEERPGPGNGGGNEVQARTPLPNRPAKQRANNTGVRRVSFRETPEKFPLKDEENPARDTEETSARKTGETSARSGEVGSARETRETPIRRTEETAVKQVDEGGISAERKVQPERSFRKYRETEETAGKQERTAAKQVDVGISPERGFPREGHRVPARPELSGEQLSGVRVTQPISIPIQVVSTPVRGTLRAENIGHYSARDCQQRESDRTQRVYGNASETPDTFTNKRGEPRVPSPVTIPIRVERTTRGEKATATSTTNTQPCETRLRSEVCHDVCEREEDRQTRGYRKIPKRSYSDGFENSSQGERPQSGSSQSSFPHPRRSSLLENLKRLSRSLDRPWSGRGVDPFMEFFSGDEHFQEFERVFETINNRRFSREMDPGRRGDRLSRGTDSGRQAQLSDRRGSARRSDSWHEDSSDHDPFDDDSDQGVLRIDETFSDFFDHDEDFMEFERELEKIKSNRRSRLLESLSRSSSCDIFADVKAFCDRSLSRSRQSLSSSGTSPKIERRTSASHSADPELWNSAEEWEFVMNKLKRNSRLFSDPPEEPAPTSPTVQPNKTGHPDQCPCLRDCQYTCHQHCVPSVTLDCTTVSPGSGDGPVATPTDLPSPSASAETSLTDRRTIVNHRSQRESSVDSPVPSRHSSQPCINVQHVGNTPQTSSPVLLTQAVAGLPPRSGGAPVSSGVQNVRITDPLTGASAFHSGRVPVLSSSSAASQSQCIEKDLNQNAKPCAGGEPAAECRLLGDDLLACDVANEKDETDSGYRSGTIPDEKLPKAPSQATLNRQELKRKIQTFNHYVNKASLEELEDGESFQGFLRVTLNLIRPITMELGARPPSIYELLTREHIVEQSTQHIAFYMPRDTVKSIHVTSKTTTKEVITELLKKFHILDNPRKFAMYEQEFNENNKLVKLRRLTDKDFPLKALLSWNPEKIDYYRLVLQENETGEIVWDNFSLPELNNFLQVLDKEENEAKAQLQYKYRIMRRIVKERLKELRKERAAHPDSVA